MRWGSSAIFWVLVGTVALAPLPLGAVAPWAWGLMGCVVGALVVAWGVRVAIGREAVSVGLKTLWPLALPFAVAVLWAVVQVLPVTPASWHHPMWQSARETLGSDVVSRISLDPHGTVTTLMRYLAYAGIFWLSLQLARQRTRARQIVFVLALAGLAYAAYGLVAHVAGSDHVLWYPKYAHIGDLSSTFLNRNMYAAYAGLTLICCTGLLLARVSESVRSPSGSAERTLRLIESLGGRGQLLVLTGIVILTTVILSHSRAGFFSSVLGLAVLIVGMGLTRAAGRRYAKIFGAVTAAVVVGFLVAGGSGLGERLAATDLVVEQRPHVYLLTLQAIKAAPALGTGLGSFAEVFQFYRSPEVTSYFVRAHNTYLENVMELGVPAALALFAVFVGFAVVTFLGVRRRSFDGVYPCIGLAVTVQLAAHSLVDFPTQVPAITASYCLVMGAACAQSWSSRKPKDPW